MLLNEMEIFYYIVELQSFSKAAEKLGVSKAFISKKMTKLEQSLNTRLLTRSTRLLVLTDTGKSFFQFCANIVQEADNGQRMLQELQGQPTGLLKISAPPAIGLYLLPALLPVFLRRYSDISLNMQLDNKIVDVIKEGYDLVLRSAKLTSSNLHVQKISTIHHVLCATPQYYREHGQPQIPAELTERNCALYTYSSKPLKPLKFIKNHIAQAVMLRGNFMSNHASLIKEMVLSNDYLGLFPEYVVRQELKDGKLIPCLDQYQIASSPLYAIYPEREFMPPKVKVFIDMLKQSLA